MGRTVPDSEILVLPVALRQLLDCGEDGLVDELIAIFQADASDRLDLLARAMESADYSTVRQEAHTIKGSALQVGANRVAEVCLQMELEARKPEPQNLGPLYRALRGSFQEVCGAIAARQPNGPDGSQCNGQ